MPLIEYAVPAYYIVACAEASSNLSRFDGVKYGWRAEQFEDLTDLYRTTRSEGFGEEVKRRILLGTFALSTGYYDAYYKKALQVKAMIKKEFDDAFSKYDVILSPVAPATAPRLDASLSDPLKMYLSDIYTVSVNLAGLPGISVPCGFDGAGMPIGVQLIGPALGEVKILNAAHAFQNNTDYHRRKPGR
jgi:aspartyl-tRNA(Asn)/glutamyl-tRNA(Gln) amidotransferase subunit A